MIVINDIKILNIKVFLHIIVIFTFIFTTLFAHPHSRNDLGTNPHTHPQNENDLIDDLDQLKDLDLQSSNPSSENNSTQNQKNKKLILFDDNLYLLDDDFDLGTDEIELQKMELNKDDLEIAKEYENFLNTFFEESNYIGSNSSNTNSKMNRSLDRLRDKVKTLESEKRTLNKKIDNLEKQLRAGNKNSGKVNDFESERRLLNMKIENLEKLLQSASKNTLNQELQEDFNSLNEILKPNRKTATSNRSRFGVSAIFGGTIPILQEGFGVGPNSGIHLNTPASFNLAGMEARVGMDLYYSIMFPKDSITIIDPISLVLDTIESKQWYSLMNIVGNISLSPSFIPSLDIRPGLGLSMSNIGEDQKTALSIPLDLIYYFPMDLAGFKIGLNLLTQVTFGHPLREGTTSFINAGLVIKTPIRF